MKRLITLITSLVLLLALTLLGGPAALPAAVVACTALIPYMAWLEHFLKGPGSADRI